MASPPVDVSIILVNWNACEMTSEAIRSIHTATRGVTFEIIVIDNGSTRDDSTRELPARFPTIVFIANARNQGFGIANNQGIARATGRYVLVLNNDTIQTEDALGASVRYMDANPRVGALGIRHLNADAGRTPQASAFAFPRPWQELASLLRIVADQPAPIVDIERDVDWVVGSFLMIRRDCLDQVGVFDERFFVYDEDIDWCRRARAAGWTIRFWPGVSMVHIGSATRPLIKDKTFMHFRSHLTYIHKHHSWGMAALYYLVIVGRLTLATVIQLLKWLTGQARFADVRERSSRQLHFALLRSGRSGV